MDYFSHSPGKGKDPADYANWHKLPDHLSNVANLAASKVPHPSLDAETRTAGILHDLGKYSRKMQQRLHGVGSGINHWAQGALVAAERGLHAVALAIYGHHVGIPAARAVRPRVLYSSKNEWNIDEDVDELLTRFVADGLCIPEVPSARHRPSNTDSYDHISWQMYTRMIFSCLCDGDFLDTEQFKSGQARPKGRSLNASELLRAGLDKLEVIASKSKASENVMSARAQLLASCLNAAETDHGLYTLTAPTGCGKTLASVMFALRQAARLGKKRVIVVIPYLTIIEQTASVFREVFGNENILEHHSMADLRFTEANGLTKGGYLRRLLSQNWDAPIIITTSVQFFESLFSNRPLACRKLHNIANSVVYFDEAQTLPPKLAMATVEAMAVMASKYSTTTVFGTATMPCFDRLSSHWRPVEIFTEHQAVFRSMKRVDVVWDLDRRTPLPHVASAMRSVDQALCIVNVTAHAAYLARLLRGPDTFMYSTHLCPTHRKRIINEIKRRLKNNEPVRLMSTQAIESGVDISFFNVWRSLAPLGSIAQAAGRCAREGGRRGTVRVFNPVSIGGSMYPDKAYEDASRETANFVWRGDCNINDPTLFTRYYEVLFRRHGIPDEGLAAAIRCDDFPKIAEAYQLIPDDSIDILVPYLNGEEAMLEFENAQGDLATLRRLFKKHSGLFVSGRKGWAEPGSKSPFAPFLVPLAGIPNTYWWSGLYDDLLGIDMALPIPGEPEERDVCLT